MDNKKKSSPHTQWNVIPLFKKKELFIGKWMNPKITLSPDSERQGLQVFSHMWTLAFNFSCVCVCIFICVYVQCNFWSVYIFMSSCVCMCLWVFVSMTV